MQTKNDNQNALKLKLLSLGRHFDMATSRLSDHERFMNAIAFSDLNSINRLVAVAVRNHKGVREIVHRIELALEGKYNVKSFQEKHYEVQRLVLSLGGPRLAYTMSEVLNLPSISTTREHSCIPHILPCIGFPTKAELAANLEALHKAGAIRPQANLKQHFPSLLRLSAGVTVVDQHITPVQLRNLLETHLEYDTPTLTRLFDNKDHQNVLNAVSLLVGIQRLAELPELPDHVEHHPIVLLGRFIGFLINPFTTPSRSLSGQLTSLSATNHLLYILYCRNRTSFCPGQWYYDVASFIKNIYFTTAYQKVLAPDSSLHILQDASIGTWIVLTMSTSCSLHIGQASLLKSHKSMQTILIGTVVIDTQDLDAVRKQDKCWIKVQNKHVHKASAIHCMLGAKKNGRKSTDRLNRVAGLFKVRTYSWEPDSLKLDDDSIIGDKVLVGDFLATFLRVKNTAALAVVRVSEILSSTRTSVSAISLEERSSSDILLHVQVLTLERSNAPTCGRWIWKGEYVSFNASSSGPVTSRGASKKSMLLHISAHLTRPIRAQLEHLPITQEDSESSDPDASNKPAFIRTFDTATLEALTEMLWDHVKPYVQSIPSRAATRTFPQRGADGNYLFTNMDGTAAMEAGPKDGNCKCFVCGEEVAVVKMRDHVGCHIVANKLKIPEAIKPKLTIGDFPCGFCGRMGTCSIRLHKPARTQAPLLDCCYFKKFSLAAAEKPTNSGPSTKRPIVCTICRRTGVPGARQARHDNFDVFWSYNMPAHIAQRHQGVSVDADFEKSYKITQDELVRLRLVKGELKQQATGEPE
ncbi:hypothetical protein TRAPUB_1455, partial [Trametes pubescens]